MTDDNNDNNDDNDGQNRLLNPARAYAARGVTIPATQFLFPPHPKKKQITTMNNFGSCYRSSRTAANILIQGSGCQRVASGYSQHTQQVSTQSIIIPLITGQTAGSLSFPWLELYCNSNSAQPGNILECPGKSNAGR